MRVFLLLIPAAAQQVDVPWTTRAPLARTTTSATITTETTKAAGMVTTTSTGGQRFIQKIQIDVLATVPLSVDEMEDLMQFGHEQFKQRKMKIALRMMVPHVGSELIDRPQTTVMISAKNQMPESYGLLRLQTQSLYLSVTFMDLTLAEYNELHDDLNTHKVDETVVRMFVHEISRLLHNKNLGFHHFSRIEALQPRARPSTTPAPGHYYQKAQFRLQFTSSVDEDFLKTLNTEEFQQKQLIAAFAQFCPGVGVSKLITSIKFQFKPEVQTRRRGLGGASGQTVYLIAFFDHIGATDYDKMSSDLNPAKISTSPKLQPFVEDLKRITSKELSYVTFERRESDRNDYDF